MSAVISRDDPGVIATVSAGIALYAGAFVWTCGGFVWLTSVRGFKYARFILRRGIPWFSPKTLAIFAFLAFLPIRVTWLCITLGDSDAYTTQFMLVQVAFVLLLTCIMLFVWYWGDSVMYFSFKRYGQRRKEGNFFNYKLTRWSFVLGLIFLWMTKGVFILVYIIDKYAASFGENAILVDKINLIYNSVCFVGLLLVFILFMTFMSWVIIKTTSERKELFTRLFKVLLIIAVITVIEAMKVGVLVFRLTIGGNTTGGLPQEAYLILAFYLPDLVPCLILCHMEFSGRRTRILEMLEQQDQFLMDQLGKKNSGGIASLNTGRGSPYTPHRNNKNSDSFSSSGSLLTSSSDLSSSSDMTMIGVDGDKSVQLKEPLLPLESEDGGLMLSVPETIPAEVEDRMVSETEEKYADEIM